MSCDSSSASADDARHVHFMQRALALAAKGRWSTPPNPAVGAVVVSGEQVVGEGYHLRPGTPHAEVIALEQAGDRAQGATIYVSLEPCDHHGRTPPCSVAIIKSGIKRVVVPCVDPAPSVSGRGLVRLRAAGVEVVEDVECEAAQRLNARHFLAAAEARPIVMVKIARTLDGRTALYGPATLAITGEKAIEQAAQHRSEVDAIMVGSGTVLADDPRLSARTTDGELLPRQPLRVIADGRLRTPLSARILSEPGGNVLFLTAAEQIEGPKAEEIREAGGRLLPVATRSEGGLEPRAMLSTLAAEGINSLLVEGGGMLLSSLVAANVVDFWQIWIAPKVIGAGRGALHRSLFSPLRLGEIHATQVGVDLLVCAFPLES